MFFRFYKNYAFEFSKTKYGFALRIIVQNIFYLTFFKIVTLKNHVFYLKTIQNFLMNEIQYKNISLKKIRSFRNSGFLKRNKVSKMFIKTNRETQFNNCVFLIFQQ